MIMIMIVVIIIIVITLIVINKPCTQRISKVALAIDRIVVQSLEAIIVMI